MRIFQSEQVIKLRHVLVLLKKMATVFARSQTIGLSCVWPDAGTLSEIHAKTARPNIAELKTALLLPRVKSDIHEQVANLSEIAPKNMRLSIHSWKDIHASLPHYCITSLHHWPPPLFTGRRHQ